MNILFTAPGRRVSLVQCFRQSCDELRLKTRFYGHEILDNAPASQFLDHLSKVPKCNSVDYPAYMLDYVKKHDIKLIVPTIDPELVALSKIENELLSLNCLPLISSHQLNQLTFDKRLTDDFFQSQEIPHPKILDELSQFPVFMKPAKGSSSVGTHVIQDEEELKFYSKRVPEPIIQECLFGQEYTLDCFVDWLSDASVVVPRKRLETRAGEISKGITDNHGLLISEAKKVLNKLPRAKGPITLQCFVNDNQISFIEINPRFGGGVPLSIKAGANFPKWIIQNLIGQKTSITQDCWQDKFMMLRYDEAVYSLKSELKKFDK